jgi:hypothetical protein
MHQLQRYNQTALTWTRGYLLFESARWLLGKASYAA